MQHVQKALMFAEMSTVKNQQHGAVCVVGGKIVCGGWNFNTDPHVIKIGQTKCNYERSVHAEVAAILNLPKNISPNKVKLIVVRKEMKLSKPCDVCMEVIRSSGIRNLYHSDDGILVKCPL